jgi:hypothetical protein
MVGEILMITINLDKAKTVAHDKRKQHRAELFSAKHDSGLSIDQMMAIPDYQAEALELRMVVLENDQAVQNAIDAAVDFIRVKAIVEGYITN